MAGSREAVADPLKYNYKRPKGAAARLRREMERDLASDARSNLKPLSLHVPEPRFRPGDAVDFAEVEVPAAGSARRPDTAEPARGFTDLAYTLVRVLDEDGRAVGP